MKRKIILLSIPYVLISIIVLIGSYIAAYILSKDNEREYEILIEQLQIKNDSLKQSNELLDVQIALQRAIADSLAKEIVNTNKVINKLKQVRYEKIRAIDSLDNNELLLFFTGFESTGPDN